MAVTDLVSKVELDAALKEGGSVVLHFWASWCQPSTQMDIVFAQLCSETPHVRFFRVEAEEQPEISEIFGVSAVPLFVFIKDGIVFDKLEGSSPAELANKAMHLSGSLSLVTVTVPASLGMASGPAVLENVKDLSKQSGDLPKGAVNCTLMNTMEVQLQPLVNASPVMLFMKGTPEQPHCGFSRKVVDVLNEVGVKYGSFDILSDDDVRQGLKKFSNWPTFPQLYCKGELLGGCDIVLEMHKSGELKGFLIEKGVLSQASPNGVAEHVINDVATLNQGSASFIAFNPEVVAVNQVPEADSAVAKGEREFNVKLDGLINAQPIMLFMKGTLEELHCGFSSKVVDALKEEGVEFGSFDVLSDDDVRQGLKAFSNWSTYPQLYIKGEFIGGYDIICEMHRNGDLKRVFSEKGVLPVESKEIPKVNLESRIKNLINSSPTLLFIKGTPDAPRCKFSSKVVTALREAGVTFGSFDILSDEEVRQGLKVYSNWPTFPQLYHNGELIGGGDIVLDMQKSGDLKMALAS